LSAVERLLAFFASQATFNKNIFLLKVISKELKQTAQLGLSFLAKV